MLGKPAEDQISNITLQDKEPNSHSELPDKHMYKTEDQELKSDIFEDATEQLNKAKILDLQNNFTKKEKLELWQPGRRYIREGVLIKLCRKTKKRRYFILLNDVLGKFDQLEVINLH